MINQRNVKSLQVFLATVIPVGCQNSFPIENDFIKYAKMNVPIELSDGSFNTHILWNVAAPKSAVATFSECSEEYIERADKTRLCIYIRVRFECVVLDIRKNRYTLGGGDATFHSMVCVLKELSDNSMGIQNVFPNINGFFSFSLKWILLLILSSFDSLVCALILENTC